MSVVSAPLGIIRVNGIGPIGKMRNITWSENIQRQEVRGIGSFTPQELPATSWSGTCSCDFIAVDFKHLGTDGKLPNALFRGGQTLQEWIDSIALQEDGITLDLYKKIPNNPLQVPMNGLIQASQFPELIAQIRGLFLNAESFNLAEGSLAGRNQSFQYLFPIYFPQ